MAGEQIATGLLGALDPATAEGGPRPARRDGSRHR